MRSHTFFLLFLLLVDTCHMVELEINDTNVMKIGNGIVFYDGLGIRET